MPIQNPSIEEFIETFVKEVNPSGIFLNALRTSGCCMNHTNYEHELEQATENARIAQREKISRLAEEGRKLIKQHPEYKTNLAELVKYDIVIISSHDRNFIDDQRYAAIAAYHHKKSSRQKTKN